MTTSFPPQRLRVLIVSDAWAPQINGVVRTLEILGRELTALGHQVAYATPQGRFSLPMPTYPEIRLVLFAQAALKKQMGDFLPNAVHIATEGPLGLAARALCKRHGIAFTTAFHTRFPDYVTARFPVIPQSLVWRWLRWFHAPALAVMVATPSLHREVLAHGFNHVRLWSRGVDVQMFRPIEGATLPYPGPIWLYVGRVTVEKNIGAFLALDLPGTKLVIGEGPARAALQARYPQARFLGALTGEDLVRHYTASSVFVFPSRTDTFGLVLLEALACGLPVAAYPVQGPLEVIGDAPVAALDTDLGNACRRALALAHAPGAITPRTFALTRSWRAATLQFIANLAAMPGA
jgi:glycosyltransferase involved in cell wall biosynthesis